MVASQQHTDVSHDTLHTRRSEKVGVFGKKGCLYKTCGQWVCSPQGTFWEGLKIRRVRVNLPQKWCAVLARHK